MTRRLAIDGDLCQGSGECAALAGDLVVFDALGVAEVVAPGEIDDALAERLVATCPSGAVSAAPA